MPRVRAGLLVVAALLAAGCFGGGDALPPLVPYPRVGDVVVYEASGALVDFARWENGVPFAAALAQVRFTVSASPDALDGSRAVHPVYRVTTEVAEAGVFSKRSDRYVSVRHGSVVQSAHPLSQDQSIVAFDERGFPWLFGASALFGEELASGARVAFVLPDNLARGLGAIAGAWVVEGSEDGLVRLGLDLPGASGALWMEPGSAWPVRVELALEGALAPHVRSDGGHPVSIAARRVLVAPGAEPLAARDRGATFGEDATVARAPWDGEKPPDGDAAAFEYPLGDAVREAKLLDRGLAAWLAARGASVLYRGTYQLEPGPAEGSTQAHWLLAWVAGEEYYEVQIARVFPPEAAPGLPRVGVPRVESSGPAEAPADANHGHFEGAPDEIVTLSEGVRVVRETFGATEIQIFLRSFLDPPGYSYFIDGGMEPGGVGRYTVVYHPGSGFIEEATGPVAPLLAAG